MKTKAKAKDPTLPIIPGFRDAWDELFHRLAYNLPYLIDLSKTARAEQVGHDLLHHLARSFTPGHFNPFGFGARAATVQAMVYIKPYPVEYIPAIAHHFEVQAPAMAWAFRNALARLKGEGYLA